MINETVEGTLQATRGEIYNPVIITLWVSILSLFVLVAWINSRGNKTNWTNFWRYWIWTAVGSGIIVTTLVMSPETVLSIINVIKEWLVV